MCWIADECQRPEQSEMEQGMPRAPVRVKMSLAMALLSSQNRNVGFSHGEEEGGSTTDRNSFDGGEHRGGWMCGIMV